jgi:hypothetical protein
LLMKGYLMEKLAGRTIILPGAGIFARKRYWMKYQLWMR